MLVSQILKTKADDSVTTVKPGVMISEAAKILAESGSGPWLFPLTARHLTGFYPSATSCAPWGSRGMHA